jgi:hypothetical protein
MTQKPIPQRVLFLLIGVALTLPIALCMVLALARLLIAMGDASGTPLVLDRIAMAGGILWTLDLIFLILAQGINALADANDRTDGP